jgi:Zn-dependent peptidase ImmA (M78 family)
MLRWACERGGLEVGEVAHRIPQLPAWEREEKQPTLKQLEGFARATHAPIGYFFLAEPPVETLPLPDFRTIADQPIARPSPDLLDTLYLCQQRQEWYRDFARLTGEPPLEIVGSVRRTDEVVETASRICHALSFDLDERRELPTWAEALRRFIEQADAAGVLVMVSGVVGSNNRRKLDPDEFRGFALVDDLAPLVCINGADTKAAQMFTLAHELVHIWLGQSALSDAGARTVPSHAIEHWCNQVAAELLVPLAVLRGEHDPTGDLNTELCRLARRFKVSTLVVLRRLHDSGRLTHTVYWDAYAAELERLQSLQKSSGGDFYLTLGTRVSKRFARALVASTLEGRSSFTEAFRLLGFKKMATFRELGIDVLGEAAS